jgi:hypothetical protein
LIYIAGDSGPFCLARSGVYLRQHNVWIVWLVFKGVDLHSGFAPSEDLAAHKEWVDSTLDAAWNVAGPQNRVGYVNYPGSLQANRAGSLNVTPPTFFGNFSSTVYDKAKEKNFADDGQVVLGGRVAHANRLAREAFFNFHNALQHSGLKLDVGLNEIFTKIQYQDPASGLFVPVEKLPFDPVTQAPEINRKLSHYAWHRSEADAVNFGLTRSMLKSRLRNADTVHDNDVNIAISFPASLPGIPAAPAQTDSELEQQLESLDGPPLDIQEVISFSKAVSASKVQFN